jgi:hypothetical protein
MGIGRMIKAFRAVTQRNPEIQAVMNAVKEFVLPLERNPILDFIILRDVEIGTTATDIPHKLNRAWQGWFVISRTSATVPYEDTQSDDTKFLTLIAGSTTTVDIYIF